MVLLFSLKDDTGNVTNQSPKVTETTQSQTLMPNSQLQKIGNPSSQGKSTDLGHSKPRLLLLLISFV